VFQPHAWSFEALRRPFAAAAASWEAAAAGWTDVVIAVSHREATTGVTRGIRSDRLEIVPNPVDPARFRPADVVDRERPGEVPPATSNRPVVLCVGRICRQKGQDDLLRAWSLVRRAVPDARLVLAGEGPLRTEIARLADDSVQLLGDRSDVADLYRQADLVVIPSRWEGMSLAMLEAMASGVSVVATDVGGVAETVGRGAGTVVPVGDVGRLADAVVKRLNDPALRLAEGATGRRLVLAEHTVDRTADRLSGIYRSLIKPSASAAVTASTSRTVSA
jgi:glycosyltransferase involved in cell wall biosynthesis